MTPFYKRLLHFSRRQPNQNSTQLRRTKQLRAENRKPRAELRNRQSNFAD